MSYAYHIATESPLKVIMGLSGLTIDEIISNEKARIWLKEIWLYHKRLELIMMNEDKKADRLRDYIFLQSWRKSLNETRDFRKQGNSFRFLLPRLRSWIMGR